MVFGKMTFQHCQYHFKMRQICNLLTLLILFPFHSMGQNFKVGERTLVYTDSLRNRKIKVEIWYPTSETDSLSERKTELPFVLNPTIRDASVVHNPFTLILLSHGTGGNRFSLAWLAIELVKQGYMVAALDHWGNTFDNKIPEYFVRYWERPLDVRFLITHLLSDKSFSPFIDKEKIGMVGFSFGGYTALALAGAELNCDLLKTRSKTTEGKKEFCIPELGDLRKLIAEIPCDSIQSSFKDDRIKAFVALAPALGLGFDQVKQTKHATDPILIIGSENDQIAPIKTNAENFHQLIPHSRLLTLGGKAGHYIFLNEGNEILKKEAKNYYVDDKATNRKAMHEYVEKVITEFFQANLGKQ